MPPLAIAGPAARRPSAFASLCTCVPTPQACAPACARRFLKGAVGLGPRYRLELVFPSGPQLSQITELCREGKLKPVVAQVLPLEQAA